MLLFLPFCFTFKQFAKLIKDSEGKGVNFLVEFASTNLEISRFVRETLILTEFFNIIF